MPEEWVGIALMEAEQRHDDLGFSAAESNARMHKLSTVARAIFAMVAQYKLSTSSVLTQY